MPISASGASYSDAAVLIAAQAGHRQSAEHVLDRFGRLIASMVRRSRPDCQSDFVDDVAGETFRMIFDPEVKRFQVARGTAAQYLFGLVKNAIQIVTRQRRPV